MCSVLALVLTAAFPDLQVVLAKSTASPPAYLPAVRKELQAQVEPLKGCYDLALKSDPALRGTVTATFTVEAGVGIAAISAGEDSIKDETLVSCVLARLRYGGDWPQPKTRLTVTATFRFDRKP
jgi:hypothetical protein